MRADKRLGQHFLWDTAVLREIAAIADAGHSAGVLEIGPGEGALTAYLVQGGRPVVALDKDPRALEAVRERLGDRVALVEGDALEVDLAALLSAPDAEGRRPIVVGNLPYNVGTAITRRLLELGDRVARHVLMLQKEVADRLVAAPGSRDWGLLSLMVALTSRAWSVLDVAPEAFRPRPKVQSSVLLVEPLPQPVLEAADREAFMAFAGALFQRRRKTLANALGDEAALRACGLDPRARPESLGLDALLALWRASGGGP